MKHQTLWHISTCRIAGDALMLQHCWAAFPANLPEGSGLGLPYLRLVFGDHTVSIFFSLSSSCCSD
jgi:hypothetical protein